MRATVSASLTALEYQERFDGHGYPRGLAGDAMTLDRPYRSRIGFDGALAEIQDERGRQFDPRAADALSAAADAGTLQLTSIHDNPGLMLRRSGRGSGV
jgi:HD-GYP domain-containing protein (c-di-GMP phosphodiesterase class II)